MKYAGLIFSFLVMDSFSNPIGDTLHRVGSYLGMTKPTSNELVVYDGKSQDNSNVSSQDGEDFDDKNSLSIKEVDNGEIVKLDSNDTKINVVSETTIVAQADKDGAMSIQKESNQTLGGGSNAHYSSSSYLSALGSKRSNRYFRHYSNDQFDKQISRIKEDLDKFWTDGFWDIDKFWGRNKYWYNFDEFWDNIDKSLEQQREKSMKFEDLPSQSERSVVEPNTGDTVALIRSLEKDDKSVVGIKLFGDYTLEKDVKDNASEEDVKLLRKIGLLGTSN